MTRKVRKICDGHMLKWLVSAGTAWLQQNHHIVNEMNVFPVPDGDTGTNMLLTMQKAYHEILKEEENHAGKVADRMAQGALRGARGNSGTILAMLLRGFANSVSGKEILDAPAFSQALQDASDYAYKTVRKVMEPVEGTILTVSRGMAEELSKEAAKTDDLTELMDAIVTGARTALEKTPDLLPKLKEAGVVDSGGMGLTLVMEGMQRLLDGKEVTKLDEGDTSKVVPPKEEHNEWERAIKPDDEKGYGYDVQFLMCGENMDVEKVRQDISAMGWSPLVDGDARMIKVHVHVYNPGKPLSYAINSGTEIDDIVVENMQLQYQEYVTQRNRRETLSGLKVVEGIGVITVGRGEGINKLFNEYHAASIIAGGQTMNPSIDDFMKAIDSLPNDEIILLPNNKNILMTAEQATSIAKDKTVRVVPTTTIPQGIIALLAYGDLNGKFSIDEVVKGMSEAVSHVISGEITRATRTVKFNGLDVEAGQLIGLVDGNLVSTGTDIPEVAQKLLATTDLDDFELVTLYYGEGIEMTEAKSLQDHLAEVYEDLEFEVVHGGQPLYPYIFSIE